MFNGEFSAVGDKLEIIYDVTNASLNYDASIEVNCTQSTTYLSINSFLVLSGQEWWALYVNKNGLLLCVGSNSVFSVSLDSSYGIRPIITVSRETLKKKIISFTIEGTTYYAEKGMYWTDWVNSSYNSDGFTISQDELNFRVLPSGSVCFVNSNAASDSLLEDGADYTLSCEGGRE